MKLSIMFFGLIFVFSGALGIAEPLGNMVDIGGYKLHLYETGIKGEPTVILDACLGNNILEWSLVQPEVAKFAHVCSYDRAGLGWSEQSGLPRTSASIVQELHTLLQNAHIKPPYIVVGHSSGGINMRLFANTYPDEVYGVILIDSSHEHQIEKFQELAAKFQPPAPEDAPTQLDVSWLPASLHDLYKALYENPAARATGGQEYEQFEESFRNVEACPNCLTNKPLIVVSRGAALFDSASPERKAFAWACHELWLDLQQDLVKKSVQGKQLIAHGCGHHIQREGPEFIVEAIREMVTQYRELQ